MTYTLETEQDVCNAHNAKRLRRTKICKSITVVINSIIYNMSEEDVIKWNDLLIN